VLSLLLIILLSPPLKTHITNRVFETRDAQSHNNEFAERDQFQITRLAHFQSIEYFFSVDRRSILKMDLYELCIFKLKKPNSKSTKIDFFNINRLFFRK